MEIYYLLKNEFLKSADTESLKYFSERAKGLSEDKYLEHLCGRFLTKFAAKNIYGIKNPEIEIVDKKPYLRGREICFSISHSQNIVLVGFDENELGVDVEYMRNRDYARLLKYYGREDINPTKNEFYKFWTLLESEIKLGKDTGSSFGCIIEENYAVSAVSEVRTNSEVLLKCVSLAGNKVDLVKEFEEPNFVLISEPVRNPLFLC